MCINRKGCQAFSFHDQSQKCEIGMKSGLQFSDISSLDTLTVHTLICKSKLTYHFHGSYLYVIFLRIKKSFDVDFLFSLLIHLVPGPASSDGKAFAS